jgi:hypothetical protein
VGTYSSTTWNNYSITTTKNNRMTLHCLSEGPPIILPGTIPDRTTTPMIGTFVTFEFDPKRSVQMCDSGTDKESIGWVKFCVKVKNDTLDLRSAVVNLEPTQRHTKFGTTHYPIHDFFDLCTKSDTTSCKRFYQNQNCKCSCRR